MKTNDIRGGVSGQVPAYVYCDEKDVHEMSQFVAYGYGRSADYFTIGINDIRCNEGDRELLHEMFPELSEEAYRAILNANVRGVEVEVIGYDPARNNLFNKLIDLRNKLRIASRYDSKIIEKINKALRKNFEQEINLDELFKY